MCGASTSPRPYSETSRGSLPDTASPCRWLRPEAARPHGAWHQGLELPIQKVRRHQQIVVSGGRGLVLALVSGADAVLAHELAIAHLAHAVLFLGWRFRRMSRPSLTRASSARSRVMSIRSGLTGLLPAAINQPLRSALPRLFSVCSATCKSLPSPPYSAHLCPAEPFLAGTPACGVHSLPSSLPYSSPVCNCSAKDQDSRW